MKNCIIRTKEMCKSFGTKDACHEVLKNITVDIYENDFTVIMGRSGSGKSTFLYSISTMDKCSKGTVELLGRDITGLKEKDVAKIRSKDIAFVFQSINLLNDLNAFENVTYPSYLSMDKKEACDRADELLKAMGIQDEKNKYPSEMSGGQRQRVAIARALATSPKILFCDEPTGALNSASGEAVLDLLTQANKNGQSIVMVTHDVKAATRGNRLLFMVDGNICETLELGDYDKNDEAKREEAVFEFLKKNNW